jgi:hypothetical protein
MKKLSLKTTLYIISGTALFLLLLFKLFFPSPVEEKRSTIFGSLQLKSDHANLISVQEKQDKKQEDQALRYKIRVKKENPFLSLYKEEKSEQKKVVPNLAGKVKKSVTAKKEQTKGFFKVSNSDLEGAGKLFRAIIKERQAVQVGKALRIVLQEPIPALGLTVGTVLKGIPRLVEERILIKITAGVSHQGVKKLALVCYDREDLLEGLYYDAKSRDLEDDIKEGLIDEALELDFKGRDLTRKGIALGRKYKDIYIEKGREVLVGTPEGIE